MPRSPDDDLLDEALTFVVRMNSGERDAPTAAEWRQWAALSPRHAHAAAQAKGLWADTGALREMPEDGPNPWRGVLSGRRGRSSGGREWGWKRLEVPGEFVTATAQTKVLTLPDGSRIELSARSGLDLGGDPGRHATLRAGQAWFKIARASAPFMIDVGDIRIEVDQGVADLDMRTKEGTAVLALGQATARLLGQSAQPLAPDSVFRLWCNIPPVPLVRRAKDSFAWRDGKLVAEELPLGEIVAVLNDWHPGWIRISGEGLAELPVTAVLDLRHPEAALRSLEHGLPIRLRNPGGVVLSLGWA
ncbi:FecR domain-containing protein [Paracoccus sp. SSJ]|uniref:FecR family protein n=1 Tax=Paracoccus sp. SSJ TaxID=3050636 RepID=UPI00254FFA65|nr:FecR domain-containing protein [Paracoccus sp. SSJ]MDK8873218.1 FecR domain-containing protein [Paracoccus sp. SSJ]